MAFVKTTLLALFITSAALAQSNDFRWATNRLFNVPQSILWQSVTGEVISVYSTGAVMQVVTRHEIRERPAVNSLTSVGQLGGGGRAIPGRVIATEIERGQKFFIRNLPTNLAVNTKQVSVRALSVEPTRINSDVFETFDYGRIATRDEIAAELDKRRVK